MLCICRSTCNCYHCSCVITQFTEGFRFRRRTAKQRSTVDPSKLSQTNKKYHGFYVYPEVITGPQCAHLKRRAGAKFAIHLAMSPREKGQCKVYFHPWSYSIDANKRIVMRHGNTQRGYYDPSPYVRLY